MILTPSQVLIRGFQAHTGLPNNDDGDLSDRSCKMFKKFYGMMPTTVAIVWSEIMTTSYLIPHLTKKDRTDKGFKSFLTALHFLWAYPKNGELLATAMGVSLRKVQGDNLWKWVKILAMLKQSKIVWPTDVYDLAILASQHIL